VRESCRSEVEGGNREWRKFRVQSTFSERVRGFSIFYTLLRSRISYGLLSSGTGSPAELNCFLMNRVKFSMNL
jgi:hypothetical protein